MPYLKSFLFVGNFASVAQMFLSVKQFSSIFFDRRVGELGGKVLQDFL